MFTSGELEMMQVLWEHGPLDPIQIEERYPRPIRNAALRSVLLVLLEKEHVSREKVGRRYVYRAATARQKSFRKMVRNLADAFCGGSPGLLIAQLARSESLSDDDIEELKRIVAEKGARGKAVKD